MPSCSSSSIDEIATSLPLSSEIHLKSFLFLLNIKTFIRVIILTQTVSFFYRICYRFYILPSLLKQPTDTIDLSQLINYFLNNLKPTSPHSRRNHLTFDILLRPSNKPNLKRFSTVHRVFASPSKNSLARGERLRTSNRLNGC